MSKTVPKKTLNHVRNLSYGIGASVLVAFLVSAVNPINGWVFGLITIVIVTLPMTLITVIVHNVQARRSTPVSEVKATPAAVGENSSQAAEAPAAPLGAKDFKIRGWIHMILGVGILTLAIVNLILLRSEDSWDRMFAEPFWWIILACTLVSFIFASTNFTKASKLTPKNQKGESKH